MSRCAGSAASHNYEPMPILNSIIAPMDRQFDDTCLGGCHVAATL
jgi:hypothetical protein